MQQTLKGKAADTGELQKGVEVKTRDDKMCKGGCMGGRMSGRMSGRMYATEGDNSLDATINLGANDRTMLVIKHCFHHMTNVLRVGSPNYGQ